MGRSLWGCYMIRVPRGSLCSAMAYIPQRYYDPYFVPWNYITGDCWNKFVICSYSVISVLERSTVSSIGVVYTLNFVSSIWRFFLRNEFILLSYAGTHPHGEPCCCIGRARNKCFPLWLCWKWVSSLQQFPCPHTILLNSFCVWQNLEFPS